MASGRVPNTVNTFTVALLFYLSQLSAYGYLMFFIAIFGSISNQTQADIIICQLE